jgi:hypothetical protein
MANHRPRNAPTPGAGWGDRCTHRITALAVTLTTLVIAAGCGGSGAGASPRPSGEAGAVYDAVLKFETTADCDGITDAGLRKLADGIGSTRDQECKIARSRSYPPASVVKIRAIHISGSNATAEVPAEGAGGLKVTEGGKTLVEKVTLIKQAGRWLVSAASLG